LATLISIRPANPDKVLDLQRHSMTSTLRRVSGTDRLQSAWRAAAPSVAA
jgi:hypothetical protein